MGFKLSTGLFQLSTGSIFFTDTKNLEKSLLHIFPAAQSIAVTKKFPAGLMLSLKERKPAAVFCGLAEKCFLMDDEGIIFEELGVIPADLPVVRSGVNTREFLLGEQAVQKTVMQTIIAVANDLENNFQVQAREVFIADLLIVKTSEHWQIYFDLESDIALQIAKMNTLLRDEIPAGERRSLKYIYLQYKDRAYYK